MTYSTHSNIPIDLMPGIGHRTAKALKRLEIKTIGQFKQVPEKVLVELFGPSIRKVHGQKRLTRKPKPKNTWQTKAKIFLSALMMAI